MSDSGTGLPRTRCRMWVLDSCRARSVSGAAPATSQRIAVDRDLPMKAAYRDLIQRRCANTNPVPHEPS
jgi:hypothetical protein